MKMYQDNRRLDFHALDREIKRKREAKGWTQEYLAQLVDRTPRSIMYFENRGQHPNLNVITVANAPVPLSSARPSGRADDRYCPATPIMQEFPLAMLRDNGGKGQINALRKTGTKCLRHSQLP
jgi:DNA-binding XRE family transcriptional regulator